MVEMILYYLHYGALLLFGILLSFSFAGIRIREKKNIGFIIFLFLVSGFLQIGFNAWFGERLVWKVYPIITHLPIILVHRLYYRKRLTVTLAAVSTAYLFCQPAKWLGIFAVTFGAAAWVEKVVQIAVLLVVGFVSLNYIGSYFARLFNKDFLSSCIFGGMPAVYYLFDYLTGIYTQLWEEHRNLTAEFLPFFMCIIFVLFCIVYYKEYEMKADSERKEHLIRIFAEQQSVRMAAMEKVEKEMQILRHDLRHFLNSLDLCLQNGEQEAARKMIAAHISRIEGAKVKQFCKNKMVNFLLSDFSQKCSAQKIEFTCKVGLDEILVDEMLFCSILSNALDNAFNAQEELPPDKKRIKLLISEAEGKLLLSVKNPIVRLPIFIDGLPISKREGHGLGTQSIRYITEQLGGNCRFSADDGEFAVRIVV